jgi:hypothetical protein
MINDAHEAHIERVRGQSTAASAQPHDISKIARAAALAGVGELGRACKVAFTYGVEADHEVAASFLAELTLQTRHSHMPLHPSSLKPAKNSIPLIGVSEAFFKMPKKSAAHQDGWTWELLRDAAHRPSTASHLRKFTELFSNGAYPRSYGHTWPRLSCTPSTSSCWKTAWIQKTWPSGRKLLDRY